MAIVGNTIAHENLVDQNAVDYRRLIWKTLQGYEFATTPGTGSGAVARSGDCLVSQRAAGANMSVDVAAGFIMAGVALGATGYDATAGTWVGMNDAVVNVPITASSATNPRIDRIGFGIRDTQYSGAVNDGQITVITGTPAGVPVAPTVPVTYIAWVDLATVAVAALSVTVVNANITDTRRRSSALGGITVCTSTTRPATSLWTGQFIYETDTYKLQQYTTATTGWQPPWNAPWGFVAQVTSTASAQTTTGTLDLAGGSLSFTAVANRYYKVSFFGSLYGDATVNQMDVYDNTAAASIVTFENPYNSATFSGTVYASTIVSTWTAGTRSLKLRLIRFFSGTAKTAGNVRLVVEDIGPSANPA